MCTGLLIAHSVSCTPCSVCLLLRRKAGVWWNLPRQQWVLVCRLGSCGRGNVAVYVTYPTVDRFRTLFILEFILRLCGQTLLSSVLFLIWPYSWMEERTVQHMLLGTKFQSVHRIFVALLDLHRFWALIQLCLCYANDQPPGWPTLRAWI